MEPNELLKFMGFVLVGIAVLVAMVGWTVQQTEPRLLADDCMQVCMRSGVCEWTSEACVCAEPSTGDCYPADTGGW